MSKAHSLAGKKRWRDRNYRQRVIGSIKRNARLSLVPKLRIGTPPDPASRIPLPVQQFIEALGDESYDVTEIDRIKLPKLRGCYRLALMAGSKPPLSSWMNLAASCDLEIYDSHTRLARSGDGIWVVLFVGPILGEN
jgi:hypothetical protein